MPDWLLPLPIFPEGSLASSVITTVWVGVFVIAFFNLRFGWVLSGLVVPGYLVPLLIARPISFVVILVEASVTYFLVWLFSERLSGGRSWSSLFGRDRFVGLILASIVVRLTFDAWLLPQFATVLQRDFASDIDWRGNLHSFGLIVISLLANQLWKPGFLRGMTQALVTIGLTFLLVRYGLMELTNFRISAVTYLYEDLASSILASPKAYIILIVTALLASRMNLRYGWDFNGVLIPALIALQWYQPLKVLTSFAEAFVIYGLAILLLRLPIFASMTIEGARKLLLFFNISFAYRLLIGHAFYWAGLDVQVTDYYGFGYLLSALMAIKMFDKDILARLTRTTLQISVFGTALGSAIGFAMMVLIPIATPAISPSDSGAPRSEDRALDPASVVGTQTVAAYAGWQTSGEGTPAPAEFEAFRQGLRQLIAAHDPETMAQASGLLRGAGFAVQRIGGGVLAVTDARQNRHGGTFLINPSGSIDLIVSVPDPLAAPGLAPASLRLMQATGARALALAGTSASLAGRGAPDLEQEYASFFQAFHEAVEGGVLRVVASNEAGGARLRVPTRLPSGLDAALIEELVGTLEIGFGREGGRTVQEVAARAGFATLHLDGSDVAQILLAGMAEPEVVQGQEGIQAYLLGVAEEQPEDSAAAPLAVSELLFFDREVLAPLLRDVIPAWPAGDLTGEIRAALAPIRQAAGIMGYGMTIYRHAATGQAHLVLKPHVGDSGIYAFRLTPDGGAYMIQVPQAGRETNTLEYGVSLFGRLDARAILIPEVAPSAKPEDAGAPDMLDPGRSATLFDLVSQVVLREHGDEPMMVVQIRGYSAETAETLPPHDAIIAFDVLPVAGGLAGLAESLVTEARTGGADVGIVSGEPGTAGLEVGWVRQAQYLEATEGARFAVVWLSPALRAVYADRITSSSETALFEALGIETVEATPASFVQARRAEATTLAPEFTESIAAYQAQRDSVALRQAQVAFPTGLRRIYDPASRQTFLAVLNDGGAVHALANLSPRDLELRVQIPAGAPDLAAIDRFVTTRAAWLLVTGAP